MFESGETLDGVLASLKASGAEEDDRVLDLLPAKAGERFLIFGEHAKDAAVRAGKERFVLVGDGGGFEMFSHQSLESRRKNKSGRGLRSVLDPG